MKGEIKQVDKRANSNGQATNPRIIIDASYIRGMKKDGAPLHTICEQGGRIVITDTLVRELIKANSSQWSAAMSRLVECRNAIEVWAHVSEMYRVELRENHPYGDPLHKERTRRLREMLANNLQHSIPPPLNKKIPLSLNYFKTSQSVITRSKRSRQRLKIKNLMIKKYKLVTLLLCNQQSR